MRSVPGAVATGVPLLAKPSLGNQNDPVATALGTDLTTVVAQTPASALALRSAHYNVVVMTRAGVYIHIPFCRSRCSYCDFATGTYESDLAQRYVTALVQEISEARRPIGLSIVDSIYLGGGTPSLLSPSQLERIFDAVHSRFSVAVTAEVTMEMNPGTVTPEKLRAYKAAGVNRASFGAQ